MSTISVPAICHDKVAINDKVLHQCAIIESLVKENNSMHIAMGDFNVCMKMPAWVSAMSEHV
jgi:hypothetical protein